jgi:predicted DNA-binding transcriptional regulator AlpA
MCNLGRVQVPLLPWSETPMSDKVQDNAKEPAVDELREKAFELSGTISRDVTTKVTQAAVKRPVSDPLGVDVDANSSVIASCIRDVCLRIGMVSAITGLSVPTIYREIGEHRFPRPIRITAGARAWRLSEIMAWIETRERDPGPTSTNARSV